MESYNNAVIPKLIDYIKQLLTRVEYSSDDGAKIELERYQSIDSNNLDINYLTTHEMTGTFTLKLYFKVTNSDIVDEFNEDLEIPKLINNVFVIDGSLRIPTNTLDNDDAVTVYDSNIRINELLNITYEEDPTRPDGYKLTIYYYEDEEPTVLDGTPEVIDQYKNLMKLEQFEIDKLKVKLDTDEVGEYLTYDLIIKLINLGSDKRHDNMIDKKVYSAESNFMKYMWSRDVRKRILTSMKSKFYQYNKIYLKDIQNAIDRYFRIASEKNIDIPTTVNPLVFDAMKYKVVIPKNVTFNQTMTDIIDVANTPINGNVNRINELNVCAVIKDDVIHIRCYTYPDQQLVEIPYTSYCTKRVLVNQYWDYDTKSFIDRTKPVKYKLRMKLYDGTSTDQFDLIEPMPDEKLSITTRRIPLGNLSDSVRVSMATSMEKQAVEIYKSEPPLVSAGHDDEDFMLSTLVTRFKGSRSVVDRIKDNKIFVRDLDTNSTQFYEIPAPTPGANDSVISFDASVQVGQVVIDGDELIVPHILRRKSFELGVNSTAIYMNYLGYTHEDGIVISQSYADRLTHYSIIDVVKELYPDDIIKYIKKIGSKVTNKDILVNNQTRLRVSSTIKDTYTGASGLLQGMGISFNQSNLVVPNNVDEGYVIDVKIEIDPDKKLTSEYSNKIIDEYLSGDKLDEYKDIPDKFKSLKANSVDIREKVSGYISFKILRVNKAKIGDKLCNRYGSKGIVSLVLPDSCMPMIEKSDGTRIPSEILLNPAAVISRKNISQLYECALSKCIFEIYKRVSKYIESNNIPEAKEFLKTYYGNVFTSLSDDEFIKLHNTKSIYTYQMKVGFFSKVSYDTVKLWMESLNITDTETIYCPDVVIVETSDGLKGFEPDKYVQVPGHKPTVHELGYCDQGCITGSEYMMKLFHSADYSGKATSSIFDMEEPILGRGHYRDEGQKIGEMELWILLETGTEKFVQSQANNMLTSQYVFLNELLLAGYTVTDSNGNPLLSNYRSKLEQLKNLGK